MTERFFAAWSGAAYRHPRWVLAIAVLATGLFLLPIFRARFENNLNTQIPTRSGRLMERIDRAFGLMENGFLLVEADEPASGGLIAFGRAFAEGLEKNPLIAEVEYGYADSLSIFARTLAPYAPRYSAPGAGGETGWFFEKEWLDRRLTRQLARLSMPGSSEWNALIGEDPFDLAGNFSDRLSSIRGAYRFNSSSPHYISIDGKAMLIRIRGRKSLNDMAGVAATVEAIQGAIEKARAASGRPLRVRAGGGYFLAWESASMVRRDLTLSISTSTALVFLLIAWTFRSWIYSLLFLPPVAIGFVAALGFFAWIHPTLTALSLGSATMLVGLGDDFTVHFLLMVKARRARGNSGLEAAAGAAGETGPSLLAAALTTIVAFLTFQLSSFSFLREMGALTALGIAGILAATLTVLPAILSFLDARSPGHRAVLPPRALGMDRWIEAILRAPKAVLAAAGVASAASIILLVVSPPHLEGDLRNIHASGSEALAAERRIGEIFGGSQEPLLLLVEADGEAALEEKLRRLEAPVRKLIESGDLAAAVSAGQFLPDPQLEKAALQRFGAGEPAAAVRERIDDALQRGGFDEKALAPAMDRVSAAIRDPLPLTLARLKELGLSVWLDRLVRPDPEDPRRALGLVTIFPTAGLWDPADRRRFLDRLDAVLKPAGIESAPVGLLTVSAESAAETVSELGKIGGTVLAIVLLIVFLEFRGWKGVLMALLPVSLGCLWTGAVFKLAGYSLHFMNAAVFPMILGMGIDYGIHAVHRYNLVRKGLAARPDVDAPGVIREAFSITGTGLALTSLTTMLAFGSLAFSRNRGLASVGALCLIGLGACLMASITALPAALLLAEKRRRARG